MLSWGVNSRSRLKNNPLFTQHNQYASLWTAFVKILLWEGVVSWWLSQEHLSVLQREARPFTVSPNVIFFWPFQHQQQISSHILWIWLTAEGSEVAVLIRNTCWTIPLNNVKMLTLFYFDTVMAWKLNYAIIWHQTQMENGQLAEFFMH